MSDRLSLQLQLRHLMFPARIPNHEFLESRSPTNGGFLQHISSKLLLEIKTRTTMTSHLVLFFRF